MIQTQTFNLKKNKNTFSLRQKHVSTSLPRAPFKPAERKVAQHARHVAPIGNFEVGELAGKESDWSL